MRLLSFAVDGQTRLGVLSDDHVVELTGQADGFPSLLTPEGLKQLAAAPAAGPRHRLDVTSFRPPVSNVSTVFCVGVNYLKKHPVAGQMTEKPVHPTIFVKKHDSLVGHLQPITYPTGISEQLDYEGELTIVIGRRGRHISEAEALPYVAGYTILNDGSVRDWQKHSLFSGKNFFRSGACGPHIVTADTIPDPNDLTLVTRVNGEEVQRTSTAAMLFSVPQIISHISTFTQLSPGDIIATGSPHGSGASLDPQRFLRPGDRVEVEISGIGTLSNPVE